MFSTGGDELNVNCYTQDAQTQADLKQSGRTLEQALDVFTQGTHGALKAIGKTPVVWEGKKNIGVLAVIILPWVYRNGTCTRRNALKSNNCDVSHHLL